MPVARASREYLTTTNMSSQVFGEMFLLLIAVIGIRRFLKPPPIPGKFREMVSMVSLLSQLQGQPSPVAKLRRANVSECNV
jgi:hypothetical protein